MSMRHYFRILSYSLLFDFRSLFIHLSVELHKIAGEKYQHLLVKNPWRHFHEKIVLSWFKRQNKEQGRKVVARNVTSGFPISVPILFNKE